MKTLKFDINDFALTTNVLGIIQDSYKLVQALSNVVGVRFVISGCEENAGVIASGIVYVNGEIMETAGGSTALLCKVESNTVVKNIQDGSYEYTEKTLLFTSGGTFNFAEVKRITNMVDLKLLIDNLDTITDDLDTRTIILEDSVQVIEDSLTKAADLSISVSDGAATIGNVQYSRANRAGDIYALQAKFDIDFGTNAAGVEIEFGIAVPYGIINAEIPVIINDVLHYMKISHGTPFRMLLVDVYSQESIQVKINTIICG